MNIQSFLIGVLLIPLTFSVTASNKNIVGSVNYNSELDSSSLNEDFPNIAEKEMIREINLVRTNPKGYKTIINGELEKLRQDSSSLSNYVSQTIKNRYIEYPDSTVIESDTIYNNIYKIKLEALSTLLHDLDTMKQLNALEPHSGIYRAAVKYGREQSPYGYIDHRGNDGSWPWDRIKQASSDIKDCNENIAAGSDSPREIVIQILIDSGVPGYGHRKNILNPLWKYVACHKVLNIGETDGIHWWIQEFGR